MELSDLITRFLAARRAEGLSPHTIDWYANHLEVYYRWLTAQAQPPDITSPATITAYYNHRALSCAPETVDGDHRTLRIFYRWLRDAGLILTSPVDAIKRRPAKRKEKRRAELDDFHQLVDSIEPVTWIDLRDRLLINMMFLCGVRVGEAVNCTAESFDVRTKLVAVDGKTGPRFVPLLPPVVEAFIAYVYARPASEESALFLSAKGDLSPRGVITTNGVRQMLKRRAKAAGVPYINPHAFRHGLAMHLLNKGGDMSLVQRVLGHSRITTTAEHYAMWLTNDLSREFAEKMTDEGVRGKRKG